MPKLLVPNRGEIAIRILRSAKELGWITVTAYTEGDESHATFADESVKLDDVSEFLNVKGIVDIVKRTQCTHLHPGYGFLSESPALALALPDSIIFVGPSLETLRISSDKLLSRNLAKSLSIQIAPGKSVSTSRDVQSFGCAEGYPVMIKALDGGGGRGIRIVETEGAIEEAFKRCIGESPSQQIFVEKALTGPSWKHIEIQVVGDGTGSVNHLWERECSVQRRFQKIIEIAPSRLPSEVIKILTESSLKMARHLKYRGLGTFEYLVNSQTYEWVFLEINPRVQVEHTVTEEINGVDLIRMQLLLSTPSVTLASFSLIDPPLPPKGYAIQIRLTAEDPSHALRLSPGTIKSTDITWPSGRGVRVDTWLTTGPFSADPLLEWTVGTEFDSLLAKIIVVGGSFEEASQKAIRAIKELKLGGSIKTNSHLLAGVLDHPNWLTGNIDTLWLERNFNDILSLGKSTLAHTRSSNVFKARNPEQGGGNSLAASRSILLQPGALFHLALSPAGGTIEDRNITKHTLTLSSIAHNGFPDKLSGTLQTSLSQTPMTFSLAQSSSAVTTSSEFEYADLNNPLHVASPLTGKIVEMHPALLVIEGQGENGNDQYIKKGETMLVLSVMKMENIIAAPNDAFVERLGKGVRVGVVLGEGALICILRSTKSVVTNSRL